MLYQIQDEIQRRTEAIESAHGAWPCRKGCDDCCRHLASEPRISESEWMRISAAIDELPPDVANTARQRIRESAGQARPVTCGLLNTASGSCLIYTARPLACRSYGFYAHRSEVLGCSRIEAVAAESNDIVWGNHAALEEKFQLLGPTRPISDWLGHSRVPRQSL